MAAKRTIPPEEPSRDMARATAERNTVKVYLQSVLSRGGTILALDHAGHDSVVTPEEGSEGLPRPHQPKPKNGEAPPPPPYSPNSLPQHYYLSAVSLRKLRRKPGFPCPLP